MTRIYEAFVKYFVVKYAGKPDNILARLRALVGPFQVEHLDGKIMKIYPLEKTPYWCGQMATYEICDMPNCQTCYAEYGEGRFIGEP